MPAFLVLSAVAVPHPLAWVVESEQYAKSVRRNASGWRFEWCAANGSRCDVRSPEAAAVRAVVGRIEDVREPFDVGMALHACGAASDIALDKCLEARAST